MEVPTDKHPVKAIVVTNKYGSVFASFCNPICKISHYNFRVFKKSKVSSRECPDTARASGINFSEIGFNLPYIKPNRPTNFNHSVLFLKRINAV